MIKSWHKFNESQSNKLTKEMAQEIIYYVSEDSKPTESISTIQWNLGHPYQIDSIKQLSDLVVNNGCI
jgi:hypothetical protein